VPDDGDWELRASLVLRSLRKRVPARSSGAMWRWFPKRPPRPSEQRVIEAALLIARALADKMPDDDAQIRALLAAGFDAGQAHRFVAFLPFAFSRPAMEAMGIKVSRRIDMAMEDGGTLTVGLYRQPEYVAGLALARRHRRSPCMPDWAYQVIAEGSADVDAASNALSAGMDVKGARIASCVIGTEHAQHAVI
jgi:hypothetical protein